MSKELRANLIFFLILLVLILPGFVILMRKKLGGTTDPNYLPVPAPYSAAYNQPPPVPPSVPRVEPAEVRAWVQGVLKEKIDPAATLFQRPDHTGPVIGNAFRSQLIHLRAADEKTTRVVVLLWEQAGADGSTALSSKPPSTPSAAMAPTLAITANGRPLSGSQFHSSELAVPKEIRHALQNAGYIDPPTTIWLCDGLFDLAATTPPSEILTRYVDRGGKPVDETISLK